MSEKTKPLTDLKALAGNESDKGCGALMHGQRVAKFGERKKRSRAMSSHLLHQSDYPQHRKLGHTVRRCANYLVFNNYYTVDQVRLAKVMTCKKHTLCPFCASARAAKSVERYLERFNVVTETKPDLIPVMLTLTVKNGDDLSERFEHLVKSFRAYQQRRRDWLKKGRGFNELCRADGGVFSYEITNKGNGWHPHLHAVLLVDSYMDVEALSREWEAITGDSKIVDVRKLQPKDGSLANAFQEVFKYALKFSDMSLEDNLTAYDTLIGKRLQGAFGSLWGVKVPDKMTDELLDDLPFIEMFYRYEFGKGYDLKDVVKRSDSHDRETPTSPGHASITATGGSSYGEQNSKHFTPKSPPLNQPRGAAGDLSGGDSGECQPSKAPGDPSAPPGRALRSDHRCPVPYPVASDGLNGPGSRG